MACCEHSTLKTFFAIFTLFAKLIYKIRSEFRINEWSEYTYNGCRKYKDKAHKDMNSLSYSFYHITVPGVKHGYCFFSIYQAALACLVEPWSEWSPPSYEGICSRTRQITRYPANGGKPCPSTTQTKLGRYILILT